MEVAIIDTGVAGYLAHGQWVCRRSCRREHRRVYPTDHGTFVASVIRSQSPTARLLSFRISRSDGSISPQGLRTAIQTAQRRAIPILNISTVLFYQDQRIDQLINNPSRSVVVTAAGNQGARVSTRMPVTPCRTSSPRVVCVAALGSNQNLLPTSNWGARWVDVAAPGLTVDAHDQSGQPVRVTGTSFAAATTSGFLSELSRHTNTTGNPLIQRALRRAHPLAGVSHGALPTHQHANSTPTDIHGKVGDSLTS